MATNIPLDTPQCQVFVKDVYLLLCYAAPQQTECLITSSHSS